MRPNNSSKRLRGRSRSKSSNPLARSYESNGPDVKIRGTALQVADKYAQLARDAQSSGDRVMAENYFQHAEHYYRIVAQAYEQSNPQGARERRDDGDRSGRYDDRSYRGEQPTINGFDGIEDDDDGLRRAIRANGSDRHSHDDDGEDGDDEATVQTNGTPHQAAEDEKPESEETGEVEATVAAPSADNAAAAEAEGESTAEAEEEQPKPRRRTRTRSTRTRTRRTTASEADAAPEATEPTS
ncbi:DUF4167 domain-containing protein [Acuticoccus mangrovi]|uniref:DUF4167 domain-containing protein n=1 Tax=Acuticoccus mangrovi TaxID=2796142 RepID=A0A934IUX5_9HYPH|nr:DUF4167 domain-containing protein [Acuticoccus mangrovi]MBJ3778485.1 DUF4167 domain-containing protein [Acuticoccus mangrovi]